MNLEEFAEKYLDIKLLPYQIEWIKRQHRPKKKRQKQSIKGMKADLVIYDDIEERREQ